MNYDYIFLKNKGKFSKIKYENLFYIKAMGDYSEVFTKNGRIIVLNSLIDFEKKLSKNMFYRCHRSFIININKIDEINENNININETNVPLSESLKKDFFEFINYLPSKANKNASK